MGGTGRQPNWRSLLKGWDAQQESFNPDRERRFRVMLDVLGTSLPPRGTVLDLGSGPGSLSVRVLRRFPRARVIAIDYDPVTLRVGRGALGNFGGRLTWVDAKLGSPGWTERLPGGKVEAAVSTTALHWLLPSDLRALYRDLGKRIRRGGVFLDGDHFPWGSRGRGLNRLAETIRRERFPGTRLDDEWTAWRRWWEGAEKIPALRPFFEERARRSAEHPHHEAVSLELHEAALRAAGFRDVGVIWQDLTNRVLFARR